MRRLLAVLVVVFPPLVSAGETPFFDLTRYNDFPEFESYIRGVARMNPDIVHMRLIGFSREHRPLLGLKVIRVLARERPTEHRNFPRSFKEAGRLLPLGLDSVSFPHMLPFSFLSFPIH
ncbi:hypothetical protein ANCDUO_26200 [Ancylostoma duodenale]|uniref:Peptidase M14 carboxypeptidase A domain-containing protein n=1 Tax=Ancylostoma duodenale TaxID=51022 RepID=A0A0C2BJ31_9BILA|nr:hypothetical protein ANCDUO_26200 [Ancylostoma duodenale]